MPTTSLPSFIFTSPTASLPDDQVFIDRRRPDTVYLTLHTFREWSKRIATGLLAAGTEAWRVRVAVVGQYHPFPCVVLGVVMAGGILATANLAFTALELAHQLKDADVSLMLATEAYLRTALDGARLAGLKRERIYVFDDTPYAGRGEDKEGIQHWQRLIASPEIGRKFVWEEFTTKEQAKCPMILLYSSGTTGPPKGVEISHFNIIANTCQTALMKDADPRTSHGGVCPKTPHSSGGFAGGAGTEGPELDRGSFRRNERREAVWKAGHQDL